MLFIGTYRRIRHAHLESRSHQMEVGAATTFPSDVRALIVGLEAAETSLGAPGRSARVCCLVYVDCFWLWSRDGRRSCVMIKIWRRSVFTGSLSARVPDSHLPVWEIRLTFPWSFHFKNRFN